MAKPIQYCKIKKIKNLKNLKKKKKGKIVRLSLSSKKRELWKIINEMSAGVQKPRRVVANR